MTKFEDQLYQQLMTEHGHHLRAPQRPAPPRRRVPRPVWLATGAAGTAAAVTAVVMALGSAPAYAAYSVTRHANGTITVAVSRPSGVDGANTTLHAMGARVRAVPVRPGCRSRSRTAVRAARVAPRAWSWLWTGLWTTGGQPPGTGDNPPPDVEKLFITINP